MSDRRQDEQLLARLAHLNPATAEQLEGSERSSAAIRGLRDIIATRRRPPWWKRRRVLIPLALAVAAAGSAAGYTLSSSRHERCHGRLLSAPDLGFARAPCRDQRVAYRDLRQVVGVWPLRTTSTWSARRMRARFGRSSRAPHEERRHLRRARFHESGADGHCSITDEASTDP